jgi:RimJ/RimL family protein N-acetyltransferase
MTFTLETRRLILREQTQDDMAALWGILGDAANVPYYTRPFTPEEVLAGICRNISRYREFGFGLWAVTLKDGGAVIGQVGLTPQDVDGTTEVEVGWQINRRVWRRGYATEAGLVSADYGLREVGLEHLISLIRPENIPSARVAEKLGMSIRNQTTHAALLHDVWQITMNEWVAPAGD